jgi:hypothetical protein
MAPNYDAVAAGLPDDLTQRLEPIDPVLKRLDPKVVAMGKLKLSQGEFDDLYAFVNEGLMDLRALPDNLVGLIPKELPSGRKVLTFQSSQVAKDIAPYQSKV